jgi:hypothetical protein
VAGGRCAKCGTPLPEGRVEFRAICAKCGSYVHVCRACVHFDSGGHHECRASATAEYVADKDRFNFCEEFRPAAGPAAGSPKKTRAEIEKLFGSSS